MCQNKRGVGGIKDKMMDTTRFALPWSPAIHPILEDRLSRCGLSRCGHNEQDSSS